MTEKHSHLSDQDIFQLRMVALAHSVETHSTGDQKVISGRLLVDRAEVLFEFLSRARGLD